MALAAASLIKGIVSKLLPTPFSDDRDLDRPVRLMKYGEIYTPGSGLSKHQFSEEGSYVLTTTVTPGTGLPYSITTAFADTTPFLYIFNQEATSTGKSLMLDYLKIINTVVPASTTQAHYAVVIDNVNRALSTDNTTTLTPVSPNPIAAPTVVPLIKAQNSATASVIAASSANKKIVARGSLGGLPVIGDELVITFGGASDAGGGRSTTSTGRQVSGAPPVIIPPQYSACVHLWFVSNAATGLSYELEFGMIAR